MKLGSLFDGSGGFPLAGALCGIEPIWASEIEPYPIAVTKSRLPKMKHLGDISKINGAKIEPVDIITFGSPCQDLSVAGKRAGLKHQNHGDGETTRSGLFMEAVRIIKEMREKTNGKYPRFALWENVPGAFSSNKGEDFRVVLEEIIKISEPNAVMPKVPQKGWAYADSYCGDGWSLAYRVLDAQYWGVPQRRRRIYLVADFGGQRAREILFKREGLRGYFTQGRTPWQTTTADVERGVGADDREGAYGVVTKGNGDAFISLERHTALTSGGGQAGQGYPCVMQPIGADIYNLAVTGDKVASLTAGGYGSTGSSPKIMEPIAVATQQGGAEITDNGICPTITAAAGMSGNNQPWICKTWDARGNGDGKAVNTITGDHENRITDYTSLVICQETIALEGNGQRPSHRGDGYLVTDKSYTLNATEVHGVVYVVDQGGGKSQANVSEGMTPTLTCTHGGEPAVAYSFDPGASRDVGALFIEECAKTLTNGTCPGHHDGVVIASTDGLAYQEKVGSLYARDYKGVGNQYVDEEKCVVEGEKPRYIVRRLTPTECARLQGFADRWGDINHKTEFSDEEYKFWLDVRNTHAAINGKQTKKYTKAQMLTWYKKLHVDSSEYKMWGNGIALPTALYVMQGIKEVSNESYKD
jgi:DNA (cytosine-5)-methyltransferase 1